MIDSSPLQRAHALSAQATHLLRPNSSPSSQTIHQALELYRQAVDLFHKSAGSVLGDDGAKRTLDLLTIQNRKLAKDLERRIGAITPSGGGESSAGALSSRGDGAANGIGAVKSGRLSVDLEWAAWLIRATLCGLVPSETTASCRYIMHMLDRTDQTEVDPSVSSHRSDVPAPGQYDPDTVHRYAKWPIPLCSPSPRCPTFLPTPFSTSLYPSPISDHRTPHCQKPGIVPTTLLVIVL